jgi:uncharacterized protein
MILTEQDKGVLLLAARQSIQSLFDASAPTIVDFNFYPNLAQKSGAFVTLFVNKNLRGCIGYILSDSQLLNTVCQAAKKSASDDRRFPPIKQDELDKLSIEISVLSIPAELKSYDDIVIGTDGLLLDEDRHRSVLLPQVAVEHNFTIEQFLGVLCEKAGLEKSTFKRKKLNIKTFNATVFSEVGKRKQTYEYV